MSDLSSDSSSSEASPDFSDVSDLDLDLPLRSAWSNRGGWSSPNTNFSSRQPDARGEDEGQRKTTPVRVSAREVVAEMDRSQRSGDGDLAGAVGGQVDGAPSSSGEN